MVDRSYYNGKILEALFDVLSKHPELRFCQLLTILDLDKDRFYEEPDKTYRKIIENRIFQ